MFSFQRCQQMPCKTVHFLNFSFPAMTHFLLVFPSSFLTEVLQTSANNQAKDKIYMLINIHQSKTIAFSKQSALKHIFFLMTFLGTWDQFCLLGSAVVISASLQWK